MATNKYFNNYSESVINEQMLLEDLVNEVIQIHGHDIWYIVREGYNSVDEIFGEVAQGKFNRAYKMEMYINNVEEFQGDRDFFSKFGLEVRDNSNFLVTRRAFERYVPTNVTLRPKEGDLLYVPLMKKMFEIKFVENEQSFFSLGKRFPYWFELRCEALRFAQEDFDTGISEIDDIEKEISYTYGLTINTSSTFHDGETVYQGANLEYATATAEVKEFYPSNGHLEIINVSGDFTVNSTVTGVTSGTTGTVTEDKELYDFVDFDDFENQLIQATSNTIVDRTESNPLGNPW